MSLSASDIARIASLARLQLAPDESERMLSQLNGFFDVVERMRSVDTTGVEPWPTPWPPSRTSSCACARTS